MRIPIQGKGHFAESSPRLLLAIGLWLCTLPLLALIAVPLIGVTASLSAAVAALALVLLACLLVCRRESRTPSRAEREVDRAPKSGWR
jgi:hypothetical protein